MNSLSWSSIGFYCLFSIFLFYQQLHGRHFRGSSAAFGLVLSVSALIGTITGLAYLVYYGWSVVWWAPFIIFIVGVLAGIAGLALEKLTGPFAISFAGFLGWPVSAYFMFRTVPSAT